MVEKSGRKDVLGHTLLILGTSDRELCLDGGRNCLTLVGVSFSMECRLCGGCRLSGWGVEDMGRNFGGSFLVDTASRTGSSRNEGDALLLLADLGRVSSSESELPSSARVGALRSFLRCTGTCCGAMGTLSFDCDGNPPFTIDDSTALFGDSGVLTSNRLRLVSSGETGRSFLSALISSSILSWRLRGRGGVGFSFLAEAGFRGGLDLMKSRMIS